MAISTSGFRHATQSIRHGNLWNSLALVSWLISAWLGMPHALKTFLENQFLFYKAGPSDVRFTI
jgi:hypothetical protein